MESLPPRGFLLVGPVAIDYEPVYSLWSSELSLFFGHLLQSDLPGTYRHWSVVAEACDPSSPPGPLVKADDVRRLHDFVAGPIYITPYNTWLAVDRGEGRAVVYHSSLDELDFGAFLDALCFILSFENLYPLHCSAFCDGVLGNVINVGPSGAGKSTILRAFVEGAGARFIADDRVTLLGEEGVPTLVAFQRARKMGLDIERLGPDELVVLGARFRAEEVETTFHRPGVRPDVVLLPNLTSRGTTTVEPVANSWDVFSGLVGETFITGVKALHEHQLRLLRYLSEVPSYRLGLGSDVRHDPGLLVTLVREAVSKR